MRATLTALCRLLLRLFFRRIDVVGAERVPEDGSVLYVLNHPNGLLDPLFIVCLSPRPVTFLAKAPLFHTFVIRHFVKAFECLPVYRAVDGEDPSKNRASIEASIALLGAGRALALFPEGKSHSEPRIEPLKTGAARIALAASAPREGRTPAAVEIIPVGLVYSAKATFRSRALLIYGEPIATPRVELDAEFRPPSDAADQLTATIATALASLTLQAQQHQAIELARTAQRIWSAAERDADGEWDPDDEDAEDVVQRRFEREFLLLAGHAELQSRIPDQVAAVVARIQRYRDEAGLLGLRVDQPIRQRRRELVRDLFVLALLAPPALIGWITHAVPYRLIDWLARRMAKQSVEVLATIKLTGGLLFFPATWLLIVVALGRTSGWTVALVGLAVIPACGWAALLFMERASGFAGRMRAAWVLLTRRDVPGWLVGERAAIRRRLVEFEALLDR